MITSIPYLKPRNFLSLPRFSHIFSHTSNWNLPDYLERLHTPGWICRPPSRRRLRGGQFWPLPASRPTKVNLEVSNSNTSTRTMSGQSTGCSAATTFVCALLHPNRHSTKVVASTKMLPKRREAASGVEKSARWRNGNPWPRPGLDTMRYPRRINAGSSTNSSRSPTITASIAFVRCSTPPGEAVERLH